MNSLTEEQLDRVAGVVLGTAVGDALGAPFEFEVAIPGPDGPQMIGGGLGDFAPGEWTDDTTLAWAVLDVAATGADLRSEDALTAIARHFYTWYRSGPPDIGAQTSMVLRSAGPDSTGTTMTAVSADTHARTGHTAGNGSLMRTAPVALAYLHDPEGVVQAARQVSALTHYDPQAQNACALWSLAIRHAVISGELDLRGGLAHLDDADAQYWTDRIDEAETKGSSSFRPNGWVVTALQAAWSSIHHTRADFDGDPQHLSQALTRAIAIGNDTDTVAAIAGGLLGARYGASAVPTGWREMCHGYPGLTGEDLIALALQTAAR